MRSSRSGTVAIAIGDSSERKQNVPNSQSMVSSLTRGVTSSCRVLAGWAITCHAACGTLLPRAEYDQ